ncbi:hypothetical protein [Cryobacterium lactosi]|nr:hypothetical protein [Cryobacterium lactosi]
MFTLHLELSIGDYDAWKSMRPGDALTRDPRALLFETVEDITL